MENLLFLGVPILKHIRVCLKDADQGAKGVHLIMLIIKDQSDLDLHG